MKKGNFAPTYIWF